MYIRPVGKLFKNETAPTIEVSVSGLFKEINVTETVTHISAVDSEFCNRRKCCSRTVDPAVDSSSPIQGAKHAVLIYISLVRKQFLNGKCSDLI